VATFVEVPEHGGTVLATGGAQGSVRGDADNVHVASVTNKVGAELAVAEVPDLDKLVPTSGDNDGDVQVGRESHAADPLLVSVLSDGVLALTEGVPQLDGLIARTGDDLTVVGGEGDGKHILRVADEAAGGVTAVEVPQAKGTVPRTRKGELAVGRDGDVLDEVAVSS